MWGRADGEGGRWDGRTSSVEDDDDDDEEEKEGDAFKVKDKMRPAPLVLTLTDEQAALVAPESNQLLHLHLRKRYYAEALDFMWMVKGVTCVFLSFCFYPHPNCFPPERRVADTYPLLIVLAYFCGCGG